MDPGTQCWVWWVSTGGQGHAEGQNALTRSDFYLTINRLDMDPHPSTQTCQPRTGKVTDLKSLYRIIPAPYCPLEGS